MIFTAPADNSRSSYSCLWLIDPACSCSVTQFDAHRISRPRTETPLYPYIISHDVAHPNYALYPSFAEPQSISSPPTFACNPPLHARRPTGNLPRLSGSPLAILRPFPVYPTESLWTSKWSAPPALPTKFTSGRIVGLHWVSRRLPPAPTR